jgi:hypothetical protein
MVGNEENILVEFDYNNIIIIDPNKVIDENGKAKERFVKQEDLVMYANLECKVIPRTKLAVGASNTDAIQTISIASMNFLKPGGKTFLDNSYTDEITGKDTIQGKGVNQLVKEKIPNNKKSDDYYIRETLNSGGNPGTTDNGLLGITQIRVSVNTAFNPTIEIEMEDVKGRALFEAGDSSPYAAFFNLPYPLFQLTLKGFYGKAVRLPLMLRDFTSRYDANSGNFKISLKFYTYKFTALADLSMAYLTATPHMYKSRVSIQTTSGGPAQLTDVKDSIVEIGYQKIKEVYSEYKSKGLIDDNFPEITIVQLQKRIENFIKNVLDQFTKQNLDPITNIGDYQGTLNEYQGRVYYYAGTSWFNEYMDSKNFYVLEKSKSKVYTYKPEILGNKQKSLQNQQNAESKLNSIISEYNTKLNKNKSIGEKGEYTINGNKKSIKSESKISIENLKRELTAGDIDFEETYRQLKGVNQPTTADTKTLEAEFQKTLIFGQGIANGSNGNSTSPLYFYQFEGENSFISITNQLYKNSKGYREQIENELTKALEILLTTNPDGLGFVPTIRNVLAVIFASGEGFLRLLDDVHREAWNQRLNKIRKDVILNTSVSNATADNKESGANETIPIYPWPQFIAQTSSNENQEKYEIQYPGDPKYINDTKGFLYDVWPEIEFVEEFIQGYTERQSPPKDTTANFNEITQPKRVTIDAIEFPISNSVFENKEQVKYFYEIFERLFLISNYSKLNRVMDDSGYIDQITQIISECEKNNIVISLSNDNPFLIQKLQQYNFNGTNFEIILRHFSNEGTGESWQNLIRGIFNTSYIKNLVNNDSFKIYNSVLLFDSITQPLVSIPNEEKLVEYLTGSTNSNNFDLTDLYPFTNLKWDKKYLANGTQISLAKDSYNTTKTLNFDTNKKIISSFVDVTKQTQKRPVSSFNYLEGTTPNSSEYTNNNIKNFYIQRSQTYDKQLPTEGNLNYTNYSGFVNAEQTTSILNTPYFVNSIQNGVKLFQDYNPNPFVASAYLFLNSLPLSTLREKFKTHSVQGNQESVNDLDYIFAVLRKYGAVHKLPYAWVLKIGSVYHRYKKYAETGEDIINSSWSGFSYVNNYDPLTNSPSRTYFLTINGSPVDIILEKNTQIGVPTGETSSLINVGFYPQLINDFNLFYQGYYIFSGYTDTAVQNGFSSGLTLNYVSNAIIDQKDGFDTNQPLRDLRVIPWSVYVNTFDNLYSYIMPSHGSLTNQTLWECFEPNSVVPNKMKIEVTGNTAVHNGAVRLFWSSPNYGYFDVNKVVKPTPYDYMKEILSGSSKQENFSINGVSSDYSKMSEIFSVFEKNVLDSFETEFLNFSKSIYDIDTSLLPKDILQSQTRYFNFQMLFRDLMKIPKPSGNNGTNIVENIQNRQVAQFIDVLKGFMEYDVVIKNGNPSGFDKKLFYSFSTKFIADPYTLDSYVIKTPNELPPAKTVAQSKADNPDAWKALETYVGFSEIFELSYKNSGSYITDFFIDNNISFTESDVVNFAPIIKMYATQKLGDSTMNRTKFINLMNEYLIKSDKFQSKISDNLFIKLQGKNGLPKVETTTERAVSNLEGPQTKIELWESFKAINDRWISGNDFTNKTLFEDVLLLDRASRNIGDKILVDVFKLRNRLLNIPEKASMLSMVQSIIQENNFVIYNIPSYVNFYNVQDAVKDPKPKPDGSLEVANTLFGTHMNVDYRDSSSKMVCFYASKPSEHLAINNIDYRFNNDAFDLRRASDNPLLEEQTGKNDWDKSNKVVGFNVDIGPQNQSMFYGFFVDQRPGTPTSESLEILNQMANQGGNRGGASQSASLYNLYKNRSYNCTVSMMGNALIQPTMYFNLRYVPMFSGPYMILRVNHTITPGNFETVFEGVRQPVYSLPKIDSFIQSLKTNLLQSILEKDKQERSKATTETTTNNVISQNTSTVNNLTNNDSNTTNLNQSCIPNKRYEKYTTQTPTTTTINITEVTNRIVQKVNDEKLRYVIFSRFYVASKNGETLQNKANNFAGIPINSDWGPKSKYFKNNYYCSSNNTPYVFFDNLDDNIDFLYDWWSQRMSSISEINATQISEFLVNNQSASGKPPFNTLSQTDKSNIISIVQESINIFNSATNRG